MTWSGMFIVCMFVFVEYRDYVWWRFPWNDIGISAFTVKKSLHISLYQLLYFKLLYFPLSSIPSLLLSFLPFRGECVSRLEALTGFDSWVLGYQKVVPIGWMNIWRMWSDTKWSGVTLSECSAPRLVSPPLLHALKCTILWTSVYGSRLQCSLSTGSVQYN